MATPTEQVQSMGELAENWDGYGAAAPQANAVALAHEFVALIEAMRKTRSDDVNGLNVSPTRVGGVLIEWRDGSLEHEIEINPDRSISFLHHDSSTGQMETAV